MSMPRSFDETVKEMFDVLHGNDIVMDRQINDSCKDEQLDKWTASMKTQSKWAVACIPTSQCHGLTRPNTNILLNFNTNDGQKKRRAYIY